MKFHHKTLALGCLAAVVAVNASAQMGPSAAAATAAAAAAQTAGATPAATDAAAATAAPGAKKPGVIRIGIMQPKADMGNGQMGTSAGDPVRTLEEQYLSGPKVEIVKLGAMLPVQATAEAKVLACDYILTSSLSQKKGGGFGNLRTLTTVASMVPGIGMATRAGSMVAQAAAATAVAAASQASAGVKAKNEVTFEYNLTLLSSGAKVLGTAQKAKAQSDGQDVITPMVQQAATDIVNLVSKPS